MWTSSGMLHQVRQSVRLSFKMCVSVLITGRTAFGFVAASDTALWPSQQNVAIEEVRMLTFTAAAAAMPSRELVLVQ